MFPLVCRHAMWRRWAPIPSESTAALRAALEFGVLGSWMLVSAVLPFHGLALGARGGSVGVLGACWVLGLLLPLGVFRVCSFSASLQMGAAALLSSLGYGVLAVAQDIRWLWAGALLCGFAPVASWQTRRAIDRNGGQRGDASTRATGEVGGEVPRVVWFGTVLVFAATLGPIVGSNVLIAVHEDGTSSFARAEGFAAWVTLVGAVAIAFAWLRDWGVEAWAVDRARMPGPPIVGVAPAPFAAYRLVAVGCASVAYGVFRWTLPEWLMHRAAWLPFYSRCAVVGVVLALIAGVMALVYLWTDQGKWLRTHSTVATAGWLSLAGGFWSLTGLTSIRVLLIAAVCVGAGVSVIVSAVAPDAGGHEQIPPRVVPNGAMVMLMTAAIGVATGAWLGGVWLSQDVHAGSSVLYTWMTAWMLVCFVVSMGRDIARRMGQRRERVAVRPLG
jgi:hypothetical protein